jgi:hypothetical protein
MKVTKFYTRQKSNVLGNEKVSMKGRIVLVAPKPNARNVLIVQIIAS